jgi:hypothetical protein
MIRKVIRTLCTVLGLSREGQGLPVKSETCVRGRPASEGDLRQRETCVSMSQGDLRQRETCVIERETCVIERETCAN